MINSKKKLTIEGIELNESMSELFYYQMYEWLLKISGKSISFEECQFLIYEYKFFLCTFSFDESNNIYINASGIYPEFLISEDEEIYDPFFYLGTINGQSPSIEEMPLKFKHDSIIDEID